MLLHNLVITGVVPYYAPLALLALKCTHCILVCVPRSGCLRFQTPFLIKKKAGAFHSRPAFGTKPPAKPNHTTV